MKRILLLNLIIFFTVLITCNLNGQIISQYVETNSGSTPKGIEIWNNTGSTLDFSINNLVVEKGTNGGTPSTDYTLSSGTLAVGAVIVIGTSDMETTAISNGSVFHSYAFTFNGDDALVVKYGVTVTDIFGLPNNDPGSAWSGNGVSTANQNIALITGITSGDTDGWTDPSIRFETISANPSGTGGLEGFGIAPTSGGSNTPPSITNIYTTPASGITPSTTVSVLAEITDTDGTVSAAELNWGTDPGDLSTLITMSNTSGDTWTTTSNIPAQTAGTTVYYQITAMDDDLDFTESSIENYTVVDNEPTNHPSGFSATPDSYSEITVTWTDSDASGYLIKGSDDSYAAIVSPVDGTEETDGTLVTNVASGNETYTFTGLSPATTYYFKIFAYNGSGATINYKTSGVPQDDATTLAAPTAPIVYFSEYVEGSSNNKAIEIYNGTGASIDLSDYTVKLGSNGGDWGNTEVLTGTLAAGDVYVIYNSGAGAEIQAVGDIASSVTFYNGNDALGLFYTTSLIDVIGVQGVNPGNAWDVAGVSEATENHTLIRKTSVTSGNTDWASSAGTDASNSEWIVKGQDYFGNLGFGGTVWTGDTDTDWATDSNWDANTPASTGNAMIPDVSGSKAPLPAITTSAACNNLNVASGATVEISATGALTVNGTFTNNGNVTIKSVYNAELDTIQNGSLIEYSGINATVEAYVPTGRWNYVSAPIDNANTSVFAGHYLQWWDEVTGEWIWVLSADSTLATDMQGLSIWPIGNATLSFTGTLNSGSRSIPLTFSTGSAYVDKGYNFVGNPYPSSIDWVGAGWTKTNVDAAIYAWTGSQYATYVGGNGTHGLTNLIPPHQGFFVHCGSGGGTLGVSDASRVHAAAGNLKNSNSNESLSFVVSGNDFEDETVIYLNQDASTGFDAQFDAFKLKGVAAAPQLYTLADDEQKLSINAQPDVPAGSIEMAFEAGSDGIFVLALDNVDGFDGVPVFLEDKLEQKIVNLKNAPVYKFYASTADDANRFNLHFSYNETPANSEIASADGLIIYGQNQKVVVASEDQLWGHVMVYDLSGRAINTQIMNGESYINLDVNGKAAYYIVSVVADQITENRKVFLK